mmetsp:Transcript_17501/g.28752  ORF Transcript_17501/g.28752 Transcript_17501/m.28752 type:complete len:87 (-) Transcript_17501:21-281(-)
MTSRFQPVKAFFQGFPDVRNVGGVDAGQLMQADNPALDDLSNGYAFIDGSAHRFENDLRDSLLALLNTIKSQPKVFANPLRHQACW